MVERRGSLLAAFESLPAAGVAVVEPAEVIAELADVVANLNSQSLRPVPQRGPDGNRY